MLRPIVALSTFTALALVAPLANVATPSKPLNIVVLYADDWRHDTLGAAGHPVVKTPHLDRSPKRACASPTTVSLPRSAA